MREDAFDRHEFNHTLIRKYKCTFNEICDKQYLCKTKLKRHIRSFHKVSATVCRPKIKCTVENCGKEFATEISRKRHHNQSHLRLNQQICKICNAAFNRKLQLRRHTVQHTNEYPYKCEETDCGKGFLNLKTFNKHKTTHKMLPTSYQCTVCTDAFPKWSQMIAHRKTHRYQCEVCKLDFSRKPNLKNHMITHNTDTERANYACSMCDRTFLHSKNLAFHIRSKHERKQYQCDFCSRSLSTKQKLTAHLELHVIGNNTGPLKKRFNVNTNNKKQRRKRKDAGKSKTSTASKLTGVATSLEAEKMILNNQGNEVILQYELKVIEEI